MLKDDAKACAAGALEVDESGATGETKRHAEAE